MNVLLVLHFIERHVNVNRNYKPFYPKVFKIYINLYAQVKTRMSCPVWTRNFCLSILMVTQKPFLIKLPSFQFISPMEGTKDCATSQKVAGSIPDGAVGIFINIILLAALWPCGRFSL